MLQSKKKKIGKAIKQRSKNEHFQCVQEILKTNEKIDFLNS